MERREKREGKNRILAIANTVIHEIIRFRFFLAANRIVPSFDLEYQ